MRVINLLTITVLLVCGTGAVTVGAAAGVVKTGFISELASSGSKKVVGWHDEHFFVTQADGSVDEVDHNGHKVLKLQGKDAKGIAILKQPESVAVADGTIYVADSESSLVAMFTLEGKFSGAFGAKRGGFFGGGAEVELSSPRGLAVHEGVVYVADSGNGKVQLFGVNGVFLGTLEIETSPENKDSQSKGLPYKLKEPKDLAVNSKGEIYVLDDGDGLIKVYGSQGNFLRYLPKEGKPLAFSMSQEGVYVAEKETLVIRRYDFNDKLNYTFGSKGEGRGLFKGISGLAAAKGQKVYVGDSKKGVVNLFHAEPGNPLDPLPRAKLRTSMRVQGSIPLSLSKLAWDGKDTLYGIDAETRAILRIQKGVVAGEIKLKETEPVSLAIDKAGALWVLDKNRRSVLKLDNDGNIQSSFGGKGGNKGQLDDPTDMVIAGNGDVYVADRGNNWVQVFTAGGGFVRTMTKSTVAALDEPSAIALDAQDNLYVLDKARNAISVFSAKGEALHEFAQADGLGKLVKPRDLMVGQDEVYVIDTNQVKVYSSKGQYLRAFSAKGNALGELDEPVAISAKEDSIFYIAERGNKRVQTFMTQHKPLAPEQVTAKDGVHAVELNWKASPLADIGQYRVYRSKNPDAGFVHIGNSINNQYVDGGLAGEEDYYYRVAAETKLGYEGETSSAVHGVAQKFSPPVLEAVQVEPTPWQIKMNWKPFEKQFVKTYLVYQKEGGKLVKVGETTEPECIRPALKPDTQYDFYVSTLSIDNIESEKFAVSATTLPFNKAPLEIEVISLRDVFSNTYKLYEEDGVGRIRLSNNTDKPLDSIKVTFVLKNVMDYPTETRIERILPGKSEEIKLKAVFNNSILTLSEDSSVQALIEASYYENGAQVVYGKSSTVKVYDKHRLSWDERGRYAAFITPKDPPIINFSRSVVTQMADAKDEAQLAAIVFDAMGTIGITYLPDPTNPYQISSGKTDTVDYIQYPRETLRRRSGDCDDLVAIYSAALESMGIYTLVIEVPGHMFMMFSTGIDADADGYTNNDLYVIHNGKLWIPVETTIVGNSFVKAWELGASNYYKWKDKGLTIMDVHESWNTFKPATLPESAQAPLDVNVKQIDKKFPGDLTSVLKISSQTKIRGYLQAIAKNPSDMDAYLQAAIILAKLGDTTEAMKYFDKIITLEPRNAAALNNRGNIFMIEGDYAAAQRNYLAATQSNPEDAEIWVNLAKSYKAAKNMKKAKEAFVNAQKRDAALKNKYKALALELLNAL